MLFFPDLKSNSTAADARGHQSARKLLGSLFYRFYRLVIRIRCRWSDVQLRFLVDPPIPLPPAFLRYRVGESLSIEEFLEVGKRSAENLARGLESVSLNIATPCQVLDFGCGCGRTLHWMHLRYPQWKFHGSDIDRDSIDWCRENLNFAQFRLGPWSPPLPYSDSHFDLVYAISVFTHLDKEAQFDWLGELARVLRGDGSLALTVHGTAAWKDYFPQAEGELADQGMIFHEASRLRGFFPSRYGTSFHSREYVEKEFRRFFQQVTYLEGSMGHQDLAVCRNPRGSPLAPVRG